MHQVASSSQGHRYLSSDPWCVGPDPWVPERSSTLVARFGRNANAEVSRDPRSGFVYLGVRKIGPADQKRVARMGLLVMGVVPRRRKPSANDCWAHGGSSLRRA